MPTLTSRPLGRADQPTRVTVLALLKAELTRIGWTDLTHNRWWGCSKWDAECRLCYADTLATRYGYSIWGRTGPRRILSAANARKPGRWNELAATHDVFLRVFCGSMMDFAEIHPVPEVNALLDAERADLWAVIEATPYLRWQLLTKRPENVPLVVPERWLTGSWPAWAWLGTSVGYQRSVDIRAPVLRSIPGPEVRYLSVEPLIGPVELDLAGIDWVIVGGESGALNAAKVGRRARPMDPAWALSVLRQAERAGVPAFMKQFGSATASQLRLTHPKGEDSAEWPAGFQVQQFPGVAA